MINYRILLALYVLLFLSAYPQEKHFIYFKDKGINKNSMLTKESTAYQDAVKEVSERAIERRKKHLNSENVITFEDVPISSNYLKEIENLGIKIENKLKWFNAISAYLTDQQIHLLKSLPFVSTIEKVKTLSYGERIIPGDAIPEKLNQLSKTNGLDYGFSFTQVNLSKVPAVHSKGITGKGVLLGVLDTGFDWKRHESLMYADVITEYDFVFGDSVTADEPQDQKGQDWHGTYCFSILAGKKDSVLIGPAYDASFMLAKTEDVRSEKNIEEDNYAAALQWMESFGVDITTSSLGYNQLDAGQTSYTYSNMDGKTTIVTKAAELAFNKGVLTITSAGNEGNKSWIYVTAPADGFNTIAVGAVTSGNAVANFSSRGPTFDGRIKPEITAMGVGVFGATSGTVNQYTYASGTSSAAPIAAGVAALLLSAYPELTNVQLRDILFKTADNYFTPDNNKGYGLVSAADAVTYPVILSYVNKFTLNKIYLDSLLDNNSVNVHLSKDGVTFNSEKMNLNGKRFEVDIPVTTTGDKIFFYFTAVDGNGNIIRTPANNNIFYSCEYGKTDVYSQMLIIPDNLVLEQNYPNPFNQGTKIVFYSPLETQTELTVYNVLGEKVKTLFNDIATKGLNQVNWDGRTSSGSPAATGIYLYAVKTGDEIFTKKMLLLR